uniref:Tic20 family protein Ycf60 n=1 Tax=Sciadococcus taiwanensis TaxID=3028030 RepID=A0A9Y1I218_9RHOD|nr:hypothetical protein SCTW_040 [Sciadococcus taiwanensis]
MVTRPLLWLLIFCLVMIILIIMINLFKIIARNYNESKETTSLLERIASCFPYLLPLIEGTQNFGAVIITQFNLINILYKYTLMELILVYTKIPFLGFSLFIILFFLFGRPTLPVRQFVRFNVMQSLLLFLLNSVLGAIFRALPIAVRSSLGGEVISNMFFFFTIITVLYSIFKAISGQYSKIPIISEAVKIQIQNL